MINASVRSPGYLLSACGAWFAGRIAAQAQYLVRFGVVGALGVVVNTALLYLLIEAGGLNRTPYSPGAKRPTLAGTVIIRYC
jgi:hypothetical protein